MRTYFIHGSNWVSTLLLALATGTLAQNLSLPGGGGTCTSNDIANVKVASCICPSSFPGPGSSYSQPCSPPAGSSVTPRYKLKKGGGVGCVDDNIKNDACYIWFSGLCKCLQQLTTPGAKTDCIASGPITSGGTPVWVLNAPHDLITTNYLAPGILQLDQIPQYYRGFIFAQNTVTNMFSNTGTLAVNSVTSRSEEQIHIHLCNNKNNKSTGLRSALTGLQSPPYNQLAQVTGFAMWCRVGSGSTIDQGGDVIKHLQSLTATKGLDNCDQYHVGSGFMIDNNGRPWSCVTTGGSAEDIFCNQ